MGARAWRVTRKHPRGWPHALLWAAVALACMVQAFLTRDTRALRMLAALAAVVGVHELSHALAADWYRWPWCFSLGPRTHWQPAIAFPHPQIPGWAREYAHIGFAPVVPSLVAAAIATAVMGLDIVVSSIVLATSILCSGYDCVAATRALRAETGMTHWLRALPGRSAQGL